MRPDPTACAIEALADEIEPILRAVGARVARAPAAGMAAEDRRALAARLEAAINARIEAAGSVLAETIQPALGRLAGEP